MELYFLLYLCLLGIVFQADRTSYVILSVIVLQQAAGGFVFYFLVYYLKAFVIQTSNFDISDQG